ncbi:MAG: tRNA pseudouridine(55) synthase TruB [Microbacteriaceae bacterium]|nr:tRNA pseudouridine(55) synthase TruB [Microbacteriaceae bacterium]
MTGAGTRSGILLIDKPQGLTSHDVVARTRKSAGTRRVGHAGTLDPMATGLLVLGINSSTRLLTWVVGLDKEYFATIRLGAATNTDDAEGEVISGAPAADITLAEVELAMVPMRGAVQQRPSSVSAIKVGGKRAYTLARAGEQLELAARRVTISALQLLGSEVVGGFLDLEVRVECSSGTYVRAIARDLGAALGVGGHLTVLRRTRIGPIEVADAVGLDDLDVASSMLAPAYIAMKLFAHYELDDSEATDLAHGKRLQVTGQIDGGPVAAIEPDGRLAGLVEIASGVARPLVNFPKDPTE